MVFDAQRQKQKPGAFKASGFLRVSDVITRRETNLNYGVEAILKKEVYKYSYRLLYASFQKPTYRGL